MIEYKDNETVTISLERYEQLKGNQKRANTVDHNEDEMRAIHKYMAENGLVFFFKPYENRVDVIKKEEPEKPEREITVNDENWNQKFQP